jgi:hypothetical protein
LGSGSNDPTEVKHRLGSGQKQQKGVQTETEDEATAELFGVAGRITLNPQKGKGASQRS